LVAVKSYSERITFEQENNENENEYNEDDYSCYWDTKNPSKEEIPIMGLPWQEGRDHRTDISKFQE